MAGEEKPRIMVSSAGYYFPDESSDHNLNTHSNQLNQFQNFESNSNQDHIYNLTTDMEMIGYFPPKNPSSTTASNWHDDQINRSFDLVDDSSLVRSFVFPSTQGLSLSLNPTNIIPSTIGLQAFDQNTRFVPTTNSRSDHGFFGKSVMEDVFFGKGGNGVFQIRNSQYLGPAQGLLNEFCNLGIAKETEAKTMKTKPHSRKSTGQWQSESGSCSKKQSLSSLELLELQKRKTKLISMLQEVDRRYNHYRNQMKAVVSSFESVAGNGTAAAYSALASKAMSRHFRCLRDGIVGQIKATKAAMGEKDETTTAEPGATHGETPRLRVLEQSLRQQRAFHQMNLTEAHHPWRTQRGLPERAVAVLRAWLFEHFLHPYPSDVDKHILARQTGLSRSQVTNWFINARVRLWKPMVEDMYLEETKDDDQLHNHGGRWRPEDQSPPTVLPNDRKPERNQLTRIDSECLSSIINHPENMDSTHTNINSPQKQPPQQRHGFSSIGDTFGSVELDFSSYNHHNHQNFCGGGGGGGSGGGGVSLTLGLQQHDGHGVVENSLVYGRGSDLGDCQTLAYRNLMGAQLLHDLGG